jgi:hypothetical protein
MVAPHFHTTAEAKAAIKKIEHNNDMGQPTGISGGSQGNDVTPTPKVTGRKKGSDDVSKRGI